MLTIPGAWVCIGLHLKSCKKLTSELGARTLFALTTEDCVHMENTYQLRGNCIHLENTYQLRGNISTKRLISSY